MNVLATAMLCLGLVVCATVLILANCPWWGALMILLASSVQVRSEEKDERKET